MMAAQRNSKFEVHHPSSVINIEGVTMVDFSHTLSSEATILTIFVF